jgi:hypothetical protein
LNQLDRYTEIGTLADAVRRAIRKWTFPMAICLAAASIILEASHAPGATAFAIITLSGSLTLALWCTEAIGLPLLPIMVVQAMIIYGVPIAAGHKIILNYPSEFVLNAGVEVMVFNFSMIAGWKFGMQTFIPAPPVSFAFHEVNKNGLGGSKRLGFSLVVAATAYLVLQGLNVTAPFEAMLPSGSSSILGALLSVMSACGFFLVSMAVGSREISPVGRAAFWGLLVFNAMIASTEFLLYTAAASLITVAIGLFWSSGKVPLRYLAIVLLSLSFLNTGKTTMRERYWGLDGIRDNRSMIEKLPAVYGEWIETSFDAIVQNQNSDVESQNANKPRAQQNQTLLDRIDNLQNLLFVMDAVKTEHVVPLHGATYSLIPPLLVPRIFWPDKPRAHEGQILLNVHFGRQDLNSTIETYIAWGLLAEAYGNFGPILGAVVIGSFLGLTFAWIENHTARKLVISTEGFLSLSILMSMVNSFEMVASVLVTSMFQSFVIVIAASAPFVHRTVTGRRHDQPAE